MKKLLLALLLAATAQANTTHQIIGGNSDWHTTCTGMDTVTGCSGTITVIGFFNDSKWRFTFIMGPLQCNDGNRLSGIQRFSGYWDKSTYRESVTIRIIGQGGAPDYRIRIDVRVDDNGEMQFKQVEDCR